jgi:hypothetical protein
VSPVVAEVDALAGVVDACEADAEAVRRDRPCECCHGEDCTDDHQIDEGVKDGLVRHSVGDGDAHSDDGADQGDSHWRCGGVRGRDGEDARDHCNDGEREQRNGCQGSHVDGCFHSVLLMSGTFRMSYLVSGYADKYTFSPLSHGDWTGVVPCTTIVHTTTPVGFN